jgi:hypothetical protein
LKLLLNKLAFHKWLKVLAKLYSGRESLQKNLVGQNGADLNYSYWTSGSDEFHEGVFSWCASQKAVNVSMDFKFKPGEPNNFGGVENCILGSVVGDPFPDTFMYSDQGCEKTHRFICEVLFL